MKSPGFSEQQLQRMKAHPGFIAALDQSSLFCEPKRIFTEIRVGKKKSYRATT